MAVSLEENRAPLLQEIPAGSVHQRKRRWRGPSGVSLGDRVSFRPELSHTAPSYQRGCTFGGRQALIRIISDSGDCWAALFTRLLLRNLTGRAGVWWTAGKKDKNICRTGAT